MHLAQLLLIPFLIQNAAVRIDTSSRPGVQKPFTAPFQTMATVPNLPRVDLNACPFEGCKFGKWTATVKVAVYSTWEPARKPVTSLSKGEEVTALTGVNVVLQPGSGAFDRDVPAYGATKGDIAYSYRECGEGAVDIWVRGRFIPCADPDFSSKNGYGCQRNCDGHWDSLGRSEWWAQIRLRNGSSGWVLVNGNFEGTDALE